MKAARDGKSLQAYYYINFLTVTLWTNDLRQTRSWTSKMLFDMYFEVFSACALIYFVIAIELTLKWNHISNVHTVNNMWAFVMFVMRGPDS